MAESEKKRIGGALVSMEIYILEFLYPVNKLVAVETHTHSGIWRTNDTRTGAKSHLRTEMVWKLRNLNAFTVHSWDAALLSPTEEVTLIDGYDGDQKYVVRVDGARPLLIYPTENKIKFCTSIADLTMKDFFNCDRITFQAVESSAGTV